MKKKRSYLITGIKSIWILLCALVSLMLLTALVFCVGRPQESIHTGNQDFAIMDKYEM